MTNDQKSETLRERVTQTTTSPGVYLMKDTDGKVIYVGKARNLRKRLASYFLKTSPSDLKTGVLIGNIATFDTIITSSEQEALILESNLIKRHRPRYNIILKDDKRYPILRLDTASPFPRLSIVRKKEKDNALYFGPFSSSGAVHQTMNHQRIRTDHRLIWISNDQSIPSHLLPSVCCHRKLGRRGRCLLSGS